MDGRAELDAGRDLQGRADLALDRRGGGGGEGQQGGGRELGLQDAQLDVVRAKVLAPLEEG